MTAGGAEGPRDGKVGSRRIAMNARKVIGIGIIIALGFLVASALKLRPTAPRMPKSVTMYQVAWLDTSESAEPKELKSEALYESKEAAQKAADEIAQEPTASEVRVLKVPVTVRHSSAMALMGRWFSDSGSRFQFNPDGTAIYMSPNGTTTRAKWKLEGGLVAVTYRRKSFGNMRIEGNVMVDVDSSVKYYRRAH
jgi:hypothetical protein